MERAWPSRTGRTPRRLPTSSKQWNALAERRSQFRQTPNPHTTCHRLRNRNELLRRVFRNLGWQPWSFGGALPHMNDGSTFLEANFIHQCSHHVDATAVNRSDVFWGCRVRDIINVKSSSFILYRDRYFARLTAAGNMDVFSTILVISVNDGVCHGFPQCDFNVAHARGNTAAIPEQEHEFVHEGRNRSHFAW